MNIAPARVRNMMLGQMAIALGTLIGTAMLFMLFMAVFFALGGK